jgi:arsenate reductase (thioredoxin)
MTQSKVLILCTGNSARSQMAEAIINAERGDQWLAVSAGTNPAARAHPMALEALADIGIETEGSRPKLVDEFMGQAFDLVITVCDDAAESCPIWPGQGRRVHVSFPDPAKATGTDDEVLTVFRQTRDDIRARLLPVLDDTRKV